MNDGDLLSSISADVGLAATVFSTSPEVAVVHCPGWTITDLVGHHGGVLRWAEAIVRTGEPVVELFKPPEGHHERLAWYLDAAQRFVATASQSNRERDCWTFGRPPGRVWFWIRRQALEAAVHRWDAEHATGDPTNLPTNLSCVGVTEVVEDLFPRQVALGRSPELSCAVELHAEVEGRSWVLSPQAGENGAVLEAPTSTLFLLLWKRAAIDDERISFTGPDEVLDQLRTTRFTP